MSDFEFEYDDEYFHGYLIEELVPLKDEERRIMLAEKEVDKFFRSLLFGPRMFQRKGYDRGTKQWAVRLLLEQDDDTDDESGGVDSSAVVDKISIDKDSIAKFLLENIEKESSFLEIVERDMQEIQADFKQDMEVMERMANYCSHISDFVAIEADVKNTQEECILDNAAMHRMMSLRTDVMNHELGMRKFWYYESKKTHEALCRNYERRQAENEETHEALCGEFVRSRKMTGTKGVRRTDGKRYNVLVPAREQLAERTLTPPAPHDEHDL